MTATGFVINGKPETVSGLNVQNWMDNSAYRLRMGNDGRSLPGRSIRGIVLHSTRGVPGGSDSRPQRVLPGTGPAGDSAEANIRYWTSSTSSGGAHIVLDYDSQIICTADLASEVSYHATSVNDYTIGIEMVQGLTSAPAQGAPHGFAFFYEEQIKTAVRLVDFLTRRFSLPRQVQSPYYGSSHPIPRLVAGGKDCYGVYQHRDQTSNRGPGDAGDFVLNAFLAAGYEPVDFSTGTDLKVWSNRQADLNVLGANLKVDGLPGPATMSAVVKHLGKRFVTRPGD